MTLGPQEANLLRQAVALSTQARDAGDQPYGALLADADGRVLLEARNTQVTGRDLSAHAELNLVRAASPLFDRDRLASCTVYASGEPCAMCAGALYWSGVGRIVYGLSIEAMSELGGADADQLTLHCRDVLAGGMRPVAVVGPALEDEARRVFDDRVAPQCPDRRPRSR